MSGQSVSALLPVIETFRVLVLLVAAASLFASNRFLAAARSPLWHRALLDACLLLVDQALEKNGSGPAGST